jgi:response regulator RpfG family c-di-GMP phosphodiesterase
MLVNDSDDARLIFRATLETAGIRVIEAEDGFDGYSLAFKEVPDLILIEHPAYVPGGTALVDALGAHERTERIRFLVATSRIVFENDPWLLRSNCAGFITKPVKPPVLLRTVSTLVGSLQHATSLHAPPPPEPG